MRTCSRAVSGGRVGGTVGTSLSWSCLRLASHRRRRRGRGYSKFDGQRLPAAGGEAPAAAGLLPGLSSAVPTRHLVSNLVQVGATAPACICAAGAARHRSSRSVRSGRRAPARPALWRPARRSDHRRMGRACSGHVQSSGAPRAVRRQTHAGTAQQTTAGQESPRWRPWGTLNARMPALPVTMNAPSVGASVRRLPRGRRRRRYGAARPGSDVDQRRWTPAIRAASCSGPDGPPRIRHQFGPSSLTVAFCSGLEHLGLTDRAGAPIACDDQGKGLRERTRARDALRADEVEVARDASRAV